MAHPENRSLIHPSGCTGKTPGRYAAAAPFWAPLAPWVLRPLGRARARIPYSAKPGPELRGMHRREGTHTFPSHTCFGTQWNLCNTGRTTRQQKENRAAYFDLCRGQFSEGKPHEKIGHVRGRTEFCRNGEFRHASGNRIQRWRCTNWNYASGHYSGVLHGRPTEASK